MSLDREQLLDEFARCFMRAALAEMLSAGQAAGIDGGDGPRERAEIERSELEPEVPHAI